MNAYAIAAEGLKVIIDTEFLADGFVAEHDNLHDSLGDTGTRIGIAPVRDTPSGGRAGMVHLETTIQVKFLGRWVKDINPNQAVDPRIVTEYAERLRRAVEKSAIQTGPLHWFMNVLSVEYGNDPTGNKTRFTAVLVASSQNTGLIETIA